MQVWELVSNVPYVNQVVGVIAAILNLILPGFGTMIASCAGNGAVSKTQLAIGLIQFLTTYILVGWIWSIYWGYLIAVKAFDARGMRGAQGAGLGMNAGAYNAAGGQFGNDPQYMNNRQGFAMQNNPGMQAQYANEFN